MITKTLHKARFHATRLQKILEERIEELEVENEDLKRKKGLSLNKTKAAQYLGLSARQLYRLEKKYPHRLSFPISIAALDEFEQFYTKEKKK